MPQQRRGRRQAPGHAGCLVSAHLELGADAWPHRGNDAGALGAQRHGGALRSLRWQSERVLGPRTERLAPAVDPRPLHADQHLRAAAAKLPSFMALANRGAALVLLHGAPVKHLSGARKLQLCLFHLRRRAEAFGRAPRRPTPVRAWQGTGDGLMVLLLLLLLR